MFNVDIFAAEYEFDKLIREFPWLEKLSLDRCKLKESFTVSNGRLMRFSLMDCYYVKHIVLDACCLNQFTYRGDCRLNITWIAASEEVEISHQLLNAYHDRLYGISFNKIAMYLANLWFCKSLTIIYDKSQWIAPEALDGLSCDIEQLRIKITKWHSERGIRRSCLLIVKEFLGMSRRPSSVLIEVGNSKEPVAGFMKLDFLYQHDEIGEGRVINTNCVCGGLSCWRCCLGELQIFQSLHAVRGRAKNLVKFFKDNALGLKNISYVRSEDEIHYQEFACCLAPRMQINGHPRHLVLRFP